MILFLPSQDSSQIKLAKSQSTQLVKYCTFLYFFCVQFYTTMILYINMNH